MGEARGATSLGASGISNVIALTHKVVQTKSQATHMMLRHTRVPTEVLTSVSPS